MAIVKGFKQKFMRKLLNISEIKESTHKIKRTIKSDQKNDLNNLQTRRKKAKTYQKTGIELSINDNTKSPRIYILPQYLSMAEKNCDIY